MTFHPAFFFHCCWSQHSSGMVSCGVRQKNSQTAWRKNLSSVVASTLLDVVGVRVVQTNSWPESVAFRMQASVGLLPPERLLKNNLLTSSRNSKINKSSLQFRRWTSGINTGQSLTRQAKTRRTSTEIAPTLQKTDLTP